MRRIYAAALFALAASAPNGLVAAEDEPTELTLGFIKLTDMAPLAIAREKGYFADEGLDVELVAEHSWDQALQNVISGVTDGAHMLAGQPLAARVGVGMARGDIVVPLSLDLNGNAITVSKPVWDAMQAHVPKNADGRPAHPIGADALRPVVADYAERGEILKLGMVFPVSTHNYELRYWLAAGGVHPGFYRAGTAGGHTGWLEGDVRLYVTPPPQMPTMLERGALQGYCVGEPWNQHAVVNDIGVAVVTDHQIWRNNPEKVLGLMADFVEEEPDVAVRLVKALLRAGQWLDADNGANRREAAEILSRPEYVGASVDVIANSMTGTFEFEKGDVRPAPDFNIFFRGFATYPYYSDAVWYLTQMRRWGQIGEAKPDDWYHQVARDVYRPDIYAMAAEALVEDGAMKAGDFPPLATESGFRPAHAEFIDAVEYDGRQPNDYLRRFEIGQKD